MHKEIKRRCSNCKTLKNRDELIKITKLKDGCIKINPSSRELGRSVYICKNKECILEFIKKKRIITALKYNSADKLLKIEEELKKLIFTI